MFAGFCFFVLFSRTGVATCASTPRAKRRAIFSSQRADNWRKIISKVGVART
jgi:hypothetical protein